MLRHRRSTGLGHFDGSLTVLACRGRSGLLLLVLIAPIVTSLRGTAVGRQDDAAPAGFQVPVDDDSKRQDDQKALKAFVEVYRLEPGQILKRVPPPRPEGVRPWWKEKYPNHGNQPHQFGSMVFRWRDPDQLENWGATTGNGFSLRELLRYLETEIYPVEIDGDLKLLDTQVTGDWVYREGIDDERKVHAIEVVISAFSG